MGSLLFQNEACVVINKAPGESSESPLPGSNGGKFPAPVHRLDMPASGCLLFAANAEAAAFLSAAFSNGRVGKRYWAVIEKPREKIPAEDELVHWISFNQAKNKSLAHNETARDRKKAVLRYHVLGQGERYLFLEIEPVTGRHHQIRAQLAARGLHIKGDLKYGAKRSERNGGIRLHAFSLVFPNPLEKGAAVKVTALPPLMDTLWTAFAGEARIDYNALSKEDRHGR
jgi:23S rRNA pseudouridine1911/1915/1917 synthase